MAPTRRRRAARTPSSTPAMSFIRSQRETCTTSGASAGRRVPSRTTAAGAATRAGGPARAVGSDEPGCDEHARRTSSRSEILVLGANGSIEGGIDARARRSIHARRERPAREDEGVGRLDVRPQEGPRALGPLVRLVAADVAAPHDSSASSATRADEPGGLRVVDDDDVARSHRGARMRPRFAGDVRS